MYNFLVHDTESRNNDFHVAECERINNENDPTFVTNQRSVFTTYFNAINSFSPDSELFDSGNSTAHSPDGSYFRIQCAVHDLLQYFIFMNILQIV